MRIVGGELRGRRLEQPSNADIRPTTDRIRENLFNILTHTHFENLSGRVLDVFAGTGALGLEALSRGAQVCVFLEKSAKAHALIGRNIDALRLQDRATVLRCDAASKLSNGEHGAFNLIFADPPYGKGLGDKALINLRENGWIEHDATVVLEEAKGALPYNLPGFEKCDEREIGHTSIGIFRCIKLQ